MAEKLSWNAVYRSDWPFPGDPSQSRAPWCLAQVPPKQGLPHFLPSFLFMRQDLTVQTIVELCTPD